jgi:PAS domain S-box-containing protein
MDLGGFYDTRPVATALIDLTGDQRGLIVSASGTLGQLLGLKPEEVLGSALSDFVHPDDQRRAVAEFAAFARGRSTTFDGIGRLVHKMGQVHWLSVHANLTTRGGPQRLLIRGFVLPVRLLDVGEARSRRASGTDKLHVALDTATAESIKATC